MWKISLPARPWFLLVLAGLFLLPACDPMSYLDTFTPPLPAIIRENLEEIPDESGNYKVRVTATIYNDGGRGNVIFEATVKQMRPDRTWFAMTKNTTVYVQGQNSANAVIWFEEFDPELPTPILYTKVYGYTK